MDGTNWYVYCKGNPISFVDPWGLYVMSIYSDPNGGSFGGHAFVVIMNDSDKTITVGTYELDAGSSVSIGTWGNMSGHKGIWYNLETAHQAIDGQYNTYVSLSMDINSVDLKIINEFIDNNDAWTAYNNCSYFASGVWNEVSDTQVSSLGLWNNPQTLAKSIMSIDGYSTGTSFVDDNTLETVENGGTIPVGYEKDGKLYIPPSSSLGYSTPRSSSDSSSGTSNKSSGSSSKKSSR